MIWTALAAAGGFLKRIPWLGAVSGRKSPSNAFIRSGGDGFFFGGETAQIPPSLSMNDGGPATNCLVEEHAPVAAGVVAVSCAVPIVLRECDKPQVRQAVICPVAIDVVDLQTLGRPFSVSQGPNHPMSAIGYIEDRASSIATGQSTHRGFAGKSGVPEFARAFVREKLQGTVPPSEGSRIEVTIKQLTKKLGLKYFAASHVAGSLRSWLGPRGVASTVAARCFHSRIPFSSQAGGAFA